MPDFTFIKHGWGGDPNLTMTLNTDSLETIRECFEDFVRGAGFVPKGEVVTEEEPEFKNFEDWEYEWGNDSSGDDFLILNNF